jgi:autotransporter family porin
VAEVRRHGAGPRQPASRVLGARRVTGLARALLVVVTVWSVTACEPMSAATRHFGTLPVGATLPSDEQCAALVRPALETRSRNTPFNMTTGHAPVDPPSPVFARVTGNFTGTTDEIIQWAACKWGIDEDVVRAQAAKESYWNQEAAGDFTTKAVNCAPGQSMGAHADRPGQCAESVGLMQVRYPYWGWAFPDSATSSAYNLDVALAAWRGCFDGSATFVNQFDRGKDYEAGDLWGCVGMWFSGRWYTQASKQYIAAVRDYLTIGIWGTPSFVKADH